MIRFNKYEFFVSQFVDAAAVFNFFLSEQMDFVVWCGEYHNISTMRKFIVGKNGAGIHKASFGVRP